MAQTIKLKRSATSGAVPTTASLALGEMAINTHDGKVYIKKDDGTEAVVEIGKTYSAGTGISLSGTTFSLTDTNAKLNLSGGTLTGDLLANHASPTPIQITRSSGTNINIKYSSASGTTYVGQGASAGTLRVGTSADLIGTGNEVWHYGNLPPSSVANWNTAYTYSQVGHVKLDGTSIITGSSASTGTRTPMLWMRGKTGDSVNQINVQGANIEFGQGGVLDATPAFKFSSQGVLTAAGQINASGGNSGQWNTAYGWGDHAIAGYYPASNPDGYTTNVGDITGVTAGTGLTGGGTSGAVTLNVIGGSGITANADNITVDSTVLRTTGAQEMNGALTIDVDNVAAGALRIEANQTNPNNDFYFAQEIYSTLSGSTALTGDREQGGIYMDINSTATGGDTSQEHRVYGAYLDVDSTGDADLVYGVYADATATPSTGQTTSVYGGYFRAEDNGGAGALSIITGVTGLAVSDNATSDTNNMYGGYFKSSNVADSGVIGTATAVYGEIEVAVGSADIYGTSKVFAAEYDNNTDAAPTNTTYLYYGNYAGVLPTSAYGVYIADTVPNTFLGTLRVGDGSTSAASYGFEGDVNTGMYSPADHELGFLTNGGERLKLTGTGATFTGTLSVGSFFSVSSTAAVSLTNVLAGSGSAGSPAYSFGGDTNTGLYRPAVDSLSITTAGVERLRVNATGSVTHNGSNVGTKIWGVSNDGSGSGLDADLLDGQQGSYYLPTTGKAADSNLFDGIDSVRMVHGSGGARTDGSSNVSPTTSATWMPSGFYDNSNGSGTPSAQWYSLIQMRHTNTGNNHGHQIAGSFYDNNLWNRNINNNTYGAWSKSWSQNNDGSGSGLDADLLDGQHGSYYYSPANAPDPTLNLLGDVSGSATFTNLNSTNLTVTVLDDSHNHSNYYLASNPNGYTNDQTAAEILTAIKTVDGSGSGLDADTVDGLHASSFLQSTNDRVYITDSRGTQRAPSYYDDRYAQWDFQNTADTLAGGDSWHALQTVSPWSVYNNGHRQQQLAWTGSGGLKFRYATSESAWAGWQTLWTSGNDGSGSGLDADLLDGQQGSYYINTANIGSQTVNNSNLLDGIDSSSFLRSDADDSTTGGLRVISGNIDSSDTTKGLLFDAQYTNGQYRTRFRKQDKGGGIPLYIDNSGGTANSYTELARFGTYSGNGYEFEVFGDINATGNLYDSGNPVWHSGNDGSGSGLDADTVDGIQGSSFLRSDTTDTASGAITFSAGTIYMAGNLAHSGDTNTYMGFHAADQWRVVTGGVERLEVNNTQVTVAGNLVSGSDITAGGRVYVQGSTTNFLAQGPYSSTNLAINMANSLFFYSGSTELASFSTTSSSFKNQIIADKSAATTGTASATIISRGTVNTTTGYNPQNFHITFQNGGNVTKGSISSSHYATIYSTSSDYRLKEDLQPISNATERLLALNPVNFKWIDGQERSDGFIAHELQEHLPEAVTGEKDATTEVTETVVAEDGTETEVTTTVPEMQGIDQSKLVPLLVKTIQELEARITALENA